MKSQLIMIVLLGFLLIPTVAGAGAANISGNWAFTVVPDGDKPAYVTFVFKQEGAKLSGAYTGPLGERPVTGTVNGDQVAFSFEVTNKSSMTVSYTGTIESPTKMSGAVEYIGGGARGKWTAAKKK
jgi:hypothetical protein